MTHIGAGADMSVRHAKRNRQFRRHHTLFSAFSYSSRVLAYATFAAPYFLAKSRTVSGLNYGEKVTLAGYGTILFLARIEKLKTEVDTACQSFSSYCALALGALKKFPGSSVVLFTKASPSGTINNHGPHRRLEGNQDRSDCLTRKESTVGDCCRVE